MKLPEVRRAMDGVLDTLGTEACKCPDAAVAKAAVERMVYLVRGVHGGPHGAHRRQFEVRVDRSQPGPQHMVCVVC